MLGCRLTAVAFLAPRPHRSHGTLSMFRCLSRLLLTAAAASATVTVLACAERPGIAMPQVQQPTKTIVDGRHSFGNPRFYFLPPMVRNPQTTGVFDTSLQPTVSICHLVSGACVTEVARFTTGDADARRRVENRGDHYAATWDTRSSDITPGQVYRLVVRARGATLGLADLLVGQNGAELRDIDEGEYIPLVDGRTLPIKFRVEQGIFPLQLRLTAGDAQTGPPGTVLVDPVEFRLLDANGFPMRETPVSVTASAGGTAVGSTVTGLDGAIRLQWTLGPTIGNQQLGASFDGLQSFATATAVQQRIVPNPTLLWEAFVGSPAAPPVIAPDGSARLVTYEPQAVHKLSSSGTIEWSVVVGPTWQFDVAGGDAAEDDAGTMYVPARGVQGAFLTERVFAFGTGGQLAWWHESTNISFGVAGVTYHPSGLVVVAGRTELRALDAATGSLRWTAPLPFSAAYRGARPVVGPEGDLYLYSPLSAQLARFSSTGALVWVAGLGFSVPYAYERASASFDANGNIVVPGLDQWLVVSRTGQVLRSLDVPNATGSMVGNASFDSQGRMFATAPSDNAASANRFCSFGAAGTLRWCVNSLGGNQRDNPLLLADNNAWVSASALRAFNAGDGEVLFQATSGPVSRFAFVYAPVASSTRLFVATGRGLVAYDVGYPAQPSSWPMYGGGPAGRMSSP
jgi:PQQ-like domain